MDKGQGDAGAMHDGMLPPEGVTIGDMLERTDKLEYRLVSRLSFEEACAIIARRAPCALTNVARGWPTGLAVVVGIDFVLRTVTVVSRSGADYYDLRTRRLPYSQNGGVEATGIEKT